MTHRPYIIILTIAFCLTSALTCFGQAQNQKNGQIAKSKSTNSVQFDTSKTAIIVFDRQGNYPFDNSYKPATLTHSDMIIIDSLFIACVNDYNESLDKDHKEWLIDLKTHIYKKQLMVVTNKKGQKEVWVNCLCRTWDNRWKTEQMIVNDGGNCYFNFKINLATKTFYDLMVNGVA